MISRSMSSICTQICQSFFHSLWRKATREPLSLPSVRYCLTPIADLCTGRGSRSLSFNDLIRLTVLKYARRNKAYQLLLVLFLTGTSDVLRPTANLGESSAKTWNLYEDRID